MNLNLNLKQKLLKANSLLKVEERQKPMLVGSFISFVSYGLSGPVLREKMMTELGATGMMSKIFAAESLIACIAGMIIPLIWRKIQQRVIKHYIKMEIFESVFVVGYYLFLLFHWNAVMYFFADVIWYALFTAILFKCANTCYNYLFPNPDSKTNADSNSQFIANFGSVVGYAIALLTPNVSWKVAIVMFCVCDTMRSVIQAYTYTKWSDYLLPIYATGTDCKKSA